MPANWHYIIVGGGSSGCVLANRLSADPDHRVLLLEAGSDTPPNAVPAEIRSAAPAVIFHGTKYLWPGLRVRPFARSSRTRFYEQARIMGGGSSVNVQVANRGIPADYDDWAAMGAQGWEWKNVLPYFRKLETDNDFAGPMHGSDGPISIRRIARAQWPAYSKLLADTLEAKGLADLGDQNGVFSDGFFPIAYSNDEQGRVSAAMAYLTPQVRSRANLQIVANAYVVGLRLNGNTVTGIDYKTNDGLRQASGATVILCAGAIQTPAILLRAGIGPAADLASLQIETVKNLAGVGRNLQEHAGTHICAYVTPEFRLSAADRKAGQLAFRFSSGTEGHAISDLYVNTGVSSAWHGVGKRLSYFYLWLNKSHSRGSVRLKSRDPFELPEVNLNLLGDERDVQRLCKGFIQVAEIVRAMASTGAIANPFPVRWSSVIRYVTQVNRRNAVTLGWVGRMLDGPASLRAGIIASVLSNAPSLDILERQPERLAAYLRKNATSVWHPSGTCKMGSSEDPMAVTDPQGRVYGIRGLRIADASLMPGIPRANTNIPVIMVAEKISDAIISDTRNGRS